MFKFLESIGLPIPSKAEIIMFIIIVVLGSANYFQYTKLKDKNEIIKNKNTEISVQNKTIDTLQEETKKTNSKIELLNEAINSTEKEYQNKINDLLNSVGDCKSSKSVDEIKSKAQIQFQSILDDLAYSTKKVR